MNVLLVEDSPTQAILTSADLMKISSEIEVQTAKTIREATRATATQKYDLIVLDVTLPDGSGVELCRTFKKDAATKSIPIVMFSAERLTDLRRDAMAAGAEYCVTKGDTGTMTLNLIVTTILKRAGRAKAS